MDQTPETGLPLAGTPPQAQGPFSVPGPPPDPRALRKAHRKDAGRLARWVLLFWVMVELVTGVIVGVMTAGKMLGGAEVDATRLWSYNGWIMMAALLASFALFLVYRNPRQLALDCATVRPMTIRAFFWLAVLALGTQGFNTMYQLGLESLLNQFGLSATEPLKAFAQREQTLPMVVCVSLVGPLIEELVFRGAALHALLPRGRSTAILVSSLMFGAYHGNLVQLAFATMVGLVLAHVALRYGLGWALILHVLNNFLMGDLPSLLMPTLGDVATNGMWMLVVLATFVLCIIRLVQRRAVVARFFADIRAERPSLAWTLSSPWMVVYFAVLLASALLIVVPLPVS